MTKEDYLRVLAASLDFLGEDERRDIVLELESHIDETLAARGDLSEEDVVSRLPPPESVGARYRAEMDADAAAGARSRAGNGRSAGGASGRGERGPFPFGDVDDFFRYARNEGGVIEGTLEGVGRLDVSSISADVRVTAGDALRYRLEGWWGDGDEPGIEADGGRLVIRLGSHCERADIEAPPSLVELTVTTKSGDVAVDLPEGASAAVKTASGDMALELRGGDASVSTASGDLVLRGSPRGVIARSASGDIRVEGATGTVSASSYSGDIGLALARDAEDAEAVTMSGDITLRLEGNPTVLLETVSGDLDCPEPEGRASGAARGPRRRRIEGGPATVRAKTVSGDITMR